MPRLGTVRFDISAMSREMLCAWLSRFASASASAPGVSMRQTIGSARLENSAMRFAAARWCSGPQTPFFAERSWAMKPT